MNKPLSKERRAEIESWLKDPMRHMGVAKGIEELLAAEAFWREAVKNVISRYDDCHFCGGPFISKPSKEDFSDDGAIRHKPDCLWLLAQDSLNSGESQ